MKELNDDFKVMIGLPYVIMLSIYMNLLPYWIPKKLKNWLIIGFGLYMRTKIPKELL